MIETLSESEMVMLELTNHIKKDAVYTLAELRRRVLDSDLDISIARITMHVNNHINLFTKRGKFDRVGWGEYKLIVGRSELRDYILEKHMDQMGIVHATIEVPGLDESAKILELEKKINILAAAFCSVGRKLQENTDLHKILIETGQRVESVMS